MALKVWHDTQLGMAGLYCSTTEQALAPMFYGGDSLEDIQLEYEDLDAEEMAQAFIDWLGEDARLVDNLMLKLSEFYEWITEEE